MTYRSAASVVAALRRALDEPSPTVGFYDRRSRSFDVVPVRTVLDRAAAVAAALVDHGVAPGRPVLVAGNTPDQLWLGYLAAVLAGATPLLLPVRPALDRSADVTRVLATARRQVPDGVLLTAGAGAGSALEPGHGLALPADGLRGPDAGSGDAAALIDRLEQLRVPSTAALHLQLTSGSTGEPRPVVITHGNATANVDSFVRAFATTPDTHLVCWLPLYHDLALVGSAVVSLLAGCHLRLLSPYDFLADPAHWLEAVARCPEAVSAGPGFALDQVVRRFDPDRCPGLDLSGWRHCITGAEPIDVGTVARFLDRLAPHGLRRDAMRFGYGLAEATLSVSVSAGEPRAVGLALPEGGAAAVPAAGPVPVGVPVVLSAGKPDPSPGVATVACLGPPVPGVGIEIVDPDTGTPLGPDVCGEVVVTGPAVSPGYRRPDGAIEGGEAGRCRTGDLGFVHQGELYLVDRLKNVIIRRGRNWSAAALEVQLAARAGLALDRCAVVQMLDTGQMVDGGEVLAVVERARRSGGHDALAESVRQAALGLEPAVDEIVILRRGALPRTTSGKKQHRLLRAALAAGTIDVVARCRVRGVERAEVEIDLRHDGGRLAAVVRLVAEHARRRGWAGPAVGEGTALRDELGFDSLALVELAADIESVLGRVVPEDAVTQVATVGDLARAAVEPAAAADGSGPRSDGGSAALVRRLSDAIPQALRRVDAQDGRRLLIDGLWVTDLASVNYLGLDVDPEVAAAVPPLLDRWGTHPSWTRAVASPAPYEELERGLAELTGADSVLVFSAIALVHIGLLPLLATRRDSVVVERSAHRSIQEGAELAAARGAELRWFDQRDPSSLARALDGAPGRPVVAVDGVQSMTGTVPDLPAIVGQAAAAGGLVYVDDAHGIGVLGADPGGPEPYGTGGGGVVAHLGLGYDHVVYVAGMSKAFSSMGAFVTCRDPDERARFEQASTAVFSGPVPVASLATGLAGLAVNAERGDGLRRHLHRLTARAIEGARQRGWAVDNPLAFPVVNLVTGAPDRTVAASKVMWDHGILFTPSVFPAAPLDRGGFRISFTAANTDDDVDRLLAALDAVAAAVGPPPASLLLSPA